MVALNIQELSNQGNELAEAQNQTLGGGIVFETEFRVLAPTGAPNIPKCLSFPELDSSEIHYFFEYYELVRTGKTNWISTTSLQHATAQHRLEPTE